MLNLQSRSVNKKPSYSTIEKGLIETNLNPSFAMKLSLSLP